VERYIGLALENVTLPPNCGLEKGIDDDLVAFTDASLYWKTSSIAPSERYPQLMARIVS
jgi:hypothetical protein